MFTVSNDEEILTYFYTIKILGLTAHSLVHFSRLILYLLRPTAKIIALRCSLDAIVNANANGDTGPEGSWLYSILLAANR